MSIEPTGNNYHLGKLARQFRSLSSADISAIYHSFLAEWEGRSKVKKYASVFAYRDTQEALVKLSGQNGNGTNENGN